MEYSPHRIQKNTSKEYRSLKMELAIPVFRDNPHISLSQLSEKIHAGTAVTGVIYRHLRTLEEKNEK